MISKTLSLYRSSFSGLSRETWLLSAILLVNRSGTMVLPFLTLYITGPDIQHSLSDAGLVMALYGLGSVAGAFLGGKLTDKTGFHKVQFYSLIFGGLLFLVLGQLRSFPLICCFTFILSMVNDAFRPANSAAIAAYSEPTNRTRSYSLNRLAVNLGWAVGASMGGLVAAWSYEALFWVDGLTNLVAALLFYFCFQSSQQTPEKKEEQERPHKHSAYRDKRYLVFIFIVSLFGMGFFQMFTTIPNYIRDVLNLSEPFIGGILAINGVIIVVLEMVLVYRLESKNLNLNIIIFGLLLCALAYPVLLLSGPGRILCLGMILLLTAGEITTMPFMNTFWTLRSNDSNRGEYAGLYAMAWGISQILGPFLSTWLVEKTGFTELYIATAFLFLLCALGFHLLKQEGRSGVSQPVS